MWLIYIINKSCTHTRVTLIGWMIIDSCNNGCFIGEYTIISSKGKSSWSQPNWWSILFSPVVLYAGCLVFRQSWFPFPLSQTDPYRGGRAALAAVSQGPSSIADKHVCLSTVCACLYVCVHVVEILCIQLKHMTWVSLPLDHTLYVSHTLTNMSFKKLFLLFCHAQKQQTT